MLCLGFRGSLGRPGMGTPESAKAPASPCPNISFPTSPGLQGAGCTDVPACTAHTGSADAWGGESRPPGGCGGCRVHSLSREPRAGPATGPGATGNPPAPRPTGRAGVLQKPAETGYHNKTSFKVLLFFIDFIENRTRNGLSQKTALRTVKKHFNRKNKRDCIMNVLEESHPTVTALVTVFKKV